jgi:predicted amino acid-binding ACT domain protein
MKTQRVATWVASITDKPGGLAAKLKTLAAGGVNIEFIIARRAPNKPGTGVVFITPVQGPKQIRAAKTAGFHSTKKLHTVRIEGADRPGLGARLTQALARQGLNLRGLSAAAIGKKFVCHIAVDSEAAATKAVRTLRGL